MGKTFAMRELGSLNYFLGIEASFGNGYCVLNQRKYASDLLKRAAMTDCKACTTPVATKPPKKMSSSDLQACSDPVLYRSLAGALQYLTITRPDLSFAVNAVCQHMHNPTNHDFVAIKRILRYVKGTMEHGLKFTRCTPQLIAFSDADWAGDSADRKSTTGSCIFLGTNLISWSAKKQATVARSSTEAEYRALAFTAADLSWIQMLLKDLSVNYKDPLTIYCDNISAIGLASNPIFHARTKHIEVDYHYVREKVVAKKLKVHHVFSGSSGRCIYKTIIKY